MTFRVAPSLGLSKFQFSAKYTFTFRVTYVVMDIRGSTFSPWTVDRIKGLSIGVSNPSVITLTASLEEGAVYAFARRAENETNVMALISKISYKFALFAVLEQTCLLNS